jgi:hypothetical protein
MFLLRALFMDELLFDIMTFNRVIESWCEVNQYGYLCDRWCESMFEELGHGYSSKDFCIFRSNSENRC